MADIAITATAVVPGANAITERGVAGEALAAGDQAYKAAATNKWMKADADSATVEARRATATVLTGSALNQPVVVQTDGDVTVGAVLTPGAAYYLSGAVAGKICPVADVGTGEYVNLVGLAKSASVLALNYQFPGVAN